MLSSHQIAAMSQQQVAMFGNNANYANQISPPGMYGAPPPHPGMVAGQMGPPGGGMMNMAAQVPYQMPGQYYSQGLAEQMTGGALGGAANLMQGAAGLYGTVTGAAGLATVGFGLGGMALGSLPMGGAVMAAGSIPAMAIGGGLAAGAYAGSEMYQGFREHQDVNRVMRQRFGQTMGIGGGRGGMGFSGDETAQMSTMMRQMSTGDMFTGFDELTRTLDKTSQMGLYRGVQSAKEFREKFKTMVGTLKEIAKTMHSSLDEAAGFMEQQRNLGYFSGDDINRSLMRTRFNAGASGMSTQQMQQIQAQGTAMGRAMGMLGRTGAEAMGELATNAGVAMQMGVLTDEDVAEATGGLTGAEGAQALAARTFQANQRWLRRRVGRPMLAGMWDKENGLDEGILQRAMSGDISIRQLRNLGRRNIAATGGRRSSFFNDEERLRGLASSQGGGAVMVGVLGQHIAQKRGLELEDPIVSRWVQRQTGLSRSEVDVRIKEFRKMPEILQERRIKNAIQLENEGRTRAREGTGLSGLSRRIGQYWDREVSGPLRQAGDDALTAVEKSIDDIVGDMEGRLNTRISDRAREAEIELRSLGKRPSSVGSGGPSLTKVRANFGGGDDLSGGFWGSVGQQLGMRAGSLDERLSSMGAGVAPGMSTAEKLARLQKERTKYASAQESIDLSPEQLSGLEHDVTMSVIRGGGAAGRIDGPTSLFRSSGADNLRAIRQRIGYLESDEGSGQFRELAQGMTEQQKIALLERASGKLSGTDHALRSFGDPGSLARSNLAYDLGAVEKYTKATRAKATNFFGKTLTQQPSTGQIVKRSLLQAGASALGNLVGGQATGALLSRDAGSRYDNATKFDMNPLFEMAEQNEQLSAHLEVLAREDAPEDERRAAMQALGQIGSGGAESVLGIKVSDQVSRAARAVAIAADQNAEGTQEALRGEYRARSLHSGAISNDLRRKQASKLQNFLSKSNRYRNEISEEVRDEFDELVNLRANLSSDESVQELEKKEHDFLRKYAHTEEGGDLLTILNTDPSGAFQGTALGLTRAWLGEKGLLQKGSRGERRRSKYLLDERMQQLVGKDFNEVFGGRSGKKLMQELKAGKISGEEFLTRIKKKMGDDFQLTEGVTHELARQGLGEIASIVEGGTEVGEITDLKINQAQRASQSARERGSQKEMSDLPSLAEKQVKHLETMIQLTKTIAIKSDPDNTKLVDAIRSIGGSNRSGGVDAEE